MTPLSTRRGLESCHIGIIPAQSTGSSKPNRITEMQGVNEIKSRTSREIFPSYSARMEGDGGFANKTRPFAADGSDRPSGKSLPLLGMSPPGEIAFPIGKSRAKPSNLSIKGGGTAKGLAEERSKMVKRGKPEKQVAN